MGLGLEQAGLKCLWRVEFDEAAAGVLAKLYPNDPLYADVVAFAKHLSILKKTEPERFKRFLVRCVAGGSPCQDLSVAGARKGLDGGRSGLFYTMVRICRILCPELILWENVLGALSSNEGRDFACVIGAFTGAIPAVPEEGGGSAGIFRRISPRGWHVAYRVLDSQHFGCAQRRKRVFLIASTGALGAGAVEILFEQNCLFGNPQTSEEEGEGVAGTLSSRTSGGDGLGTDFELGGGIQPVSSPLTTRPYADDGFSNIDSLVPSTVGALTDGAHMGGGLNGQDAYTGRIFASRRVGASGTGRERAGFQHEGWSSNRGSL